MVRERAAGTKRAHRPPDAHDGGTPFYGEWRRSAYHGSTVAAPPLSPHAIRRVSDRTDMAHCCSRGRGEGPQARPRTSPTIGDRRAVNLPAADRSVVGPSPTGVA